MSSEDGPIPDIRNDPKAWFNFFDKTNKGTLEKSEVLQALIDTLNATTGNIPDIGNLFVINFYKKQLKYV